jgi:hypothetical protein
LGDRKKRRIDVKKNGDKTIEQMRQAIKNYSGPVTECPPGKARAPVEVAVLKNKSVEWLKQNRPAKPVRDKKAARRKMRMACAKQQRVAKRNAALLKRVGVAEKWIQNDESTPHHSH